MAQGVIIEEAGNIDVQERLDANETNNILIETRASNISGHTVLCVAPGHKVKVLKLFVKAFEARL